jgi:hypothetical protein
MSQDSSENSAGSSNTAFQIADTLSSAKQCLANFLSELTKRSKIENLDLDERKSYWRIQNAAKNLTRFENSLPKIQAEMIKPTPYLYVASILPVESPPLELNEAILNEEKVHETEAVTPLPAITMSLASCSTSNVAEVKIETITPSTSTTVNIPQSVLTLLSTTTTLSTAAEVATAAAATVTAKLEIEKLRASSQTLKEFANKMGSASRATDLQQWLEVSKGYWGVIRKRKKDDIRQRKQQRHEQKRQLQQEQLQQQQQQRQQQQQQQQEQQKQQQEQQPKEEKDQIQQQQYSADLHLDKSSILIIPEKVFSLQSQYSALNTEILRQPEVQKEPDLSSERMLMPGFGSIAKQLTVIHPADVTMTLWGVDRFELWPSLLVATNPSYSYDDNPLPGWRKHICVQMGGKTQGTLTIAYSPPKSTRRLRSKLELQAYLVKCNLSNSIINRFNYRTVFCVCHAPEDGRNYLECAFGRAGCNRWLHSECVGLGELTQGKLQEMGTFICPLCSVYLESIGASAFMKDKM